MKLVLEHDKIEKEFIYFTLTMKRGSYIKGMLMQSEDVATLIDGIDADIGLLSMFVLNKELPCPALLIETIWVDPKHRGQRLTEAGIIFLKNTLAFASIVLQPSPQKLERRSEITEEEIDYDTKHRPRLVKYYKSMGFKATKGTLRVGYCEWKQAVMYWTIWLDKGNHNGK
jgi:hypothetical protein